MDITPETRTKFPSGKRIAIQIGRRTNWIDGGKATMKAADDIQHDRPVAREVGLEHCQRTLSKLATPSISLKNGSTRSGRSLRRFGTGEITEGDADAQIFQLRYGPEDAGPDRHRQSR
jgi:hypothetical protein